jgi:hypothetical protein
MLRKSKNDLGDFMHDDMGFGSAVEHAFGQHTAAKKCTNCRRPLGGPEFGKTMGCHDCNGEFCSAGCVDQHESKTKHGKTSSKTAGKFKLYTGPTIVKQTADELRNAGIEVTVEGTEHVHFLADGDRDQVTLQLRDILGPQWGVKGVQQISAAGSEPKSKCPKCKGSGRNEEATAKMRAGGGSTGHVRCSYCNGNGWDPIGNFNFGKGAANLIHSDSELGEKMELAQQPEHAPGPEAGPSNDELLENTHEEHGVPVTDGGIKSPERQNVNAIREAIETQAEMEVGKPIAQKQEEVIKGEAVRDEKLMNPGGATEVTAKPGTQIIINVASKDAAGFKQGTRVRISEGSGIDSNKEGVIIPWGSARAKEVEFDYPFVGGRSAQGMNWVCVLLDDDQVTTVPKSRAINLGKGWSMPTDPPAQKEMFSAQVQAEGIGGENMDKITSGHGGGSFGGTDLTGPDFHVGFTLKGKPRTQKFTSLASANAFVKEASEKFGITGAWTMKCPWCGSTAQKDNPLDPWKCSKCDWDSEKQQKKGAVDSTQKALVLEWLKTNNLTTGEVEKRLGAAPHSNTAYPILMELAREGKVKHKQMRWYLKDPVPVQAAAKQAEISATPLPYACYIVDEDGLTESATNAASVAEAMQFFATRGIDPSEIKAMDKGDTSIFTWMRTASAKTADYDGWTDKQTHDLNLYIDQERDTNKIRVDLGKAALEQGWSAEELAERLKKFMQKPYRMVKREFEEAAQETRDDRGAHERRQLTGEPLPSTGRHNEDIINQLWDFRHEVGMAGEEQPWTEPNWVEIAQFAIDEAKNNADAKLRDMPDKELAGTMGIKMESLRVGRKVAEMDPAAANQLRVAIKTLKMPDAMAGVMGGPTKEQAQNILHRHGLAWDGQRVVEMDPETAANEQAFHGKGAGEGMAKTEQELEKEAGFNFFFPGQVLKEFYPEIQHEIVDYPNSSNQPMSGAGNPEIVGDAGHELEGVLDSALDTTIVEMIQLPGDMDEQEPMAMAAADYAPTKPGGAMGIGRDGKPEVLEGVPLRKENDIRGEMFTDEFYGQYQGVPGAALAVASQKVAAADEAKQFSRFLKMVCGEIAATMIAAFKVTSRPLLDKVPGVGDVQLDQIEQAQALLGGNTTSTGSRVKYLMDKLSDSEIQTAVNEAWAQGAVWHDGDNGGFIYEVFVRPETIDTESMKLKYKFVAGTRE